MTVVAPDNGLQGPQYFQFLEVRASIRIRGEVGKERKQLSRDSCLE